MLLVTADIGARERLTRALRGHGVAVAERRDGPPPAVDVVLVDTRTQAQTQKQLDIVQADVRMRWASIVSVDFAKIAPVGAMPADLEALTEVMEPAVSADRALLREVLREEQLMLRLAPLGPIRILRVVAASGRTMHLTFEAMRVRGEIDMADGLVVCAFSSADGRDLEGGIALAPLLDLDDALVRIQGCEHPTAVNVMEPVEQALELAAVARQSLVQPRCPANDTEALHEADVSILEDFSILEEIQTSGVRPGRPSERPTIGDASNGSTPEGQVPSLHPVDEVPTAPAPRAPSQPGTHRVAVGSMDKKFAKTMLGASAPRPPSPGPPPARPAAPPARPAAPPPAPEPPAAQAPPEAPKEARSANAELSSKPPGKTLWGVAPPPKPSSGLGGLPSPDPRLSAPAQENPASADAFAQTQLGMPSPVADEAPDQPEDNEPDLPGDDDVTQRPPPPDDAGAIHAESDGLGIGREHERAPTEPEGEREELSIASALSVALEEASEERSAAEARARAEAEPVAAEPSERISAQGEEGTPKKRGMGLRVALVVGALALGVAGGVLWWRGKQARDASAAALPAPEQPLPSAATRDPEPELAASPPGTVEDIAQEPRGQAVAANSIQQPTPQGDPDVLADPFAEETADPSVDEAEAESLEVAGANAEGDANKGDDAPAPGKEAPTTQREGERDQAGSDKVCKTARRLERDGAFDEAMELYEQGRELDPRNPRAYEGITRIQLQKGNYEEAIVAAERAVDLRSRRARYRVMLGDAYMAVGRGSDAKRAWNKALDLEPENEAAKQRLR